MQGTGPGTVAKAAAASGAGMVHVSAIGADANSPSRYGRSKAAGEQAVLAAVPSATILRPSVVFGPEDDFTNRFAALARISPALPLIGGGLTRLQPVYVGDVATAVADAVDGKTKAGATYELGGPEVLTMREIMEIILSVIERRRMLVTLPFGLAKLQGDVPAVRAGRPEADAGPGELLRSDNVVSEAAKAAGLTLEGLGITAGFAAGDRPAISLALPRRRPVPAQERVGDLQGGEGALRAMVAASGTSAQRLYRPIASAIRPSVPTMTRHHANSAKPWRVT